MNCFNSIYGKKSIREEVKDPAKQEGLQISEIHSFWTTFKGSSFFRSLPMWPFGALQWDFSAFYCSLIDARSLLNLCHILQLYHCSVQVDF